MSRQYNQLYTQLKTLLNACPPEQQAEATACLEAFATYQKTTQRTLSTTRASLLRLNAARQHLSALYEAAPVPYFVFDPSGRVISLNTAAADMLRVPYESHSFSFASYLLPKSQKLFETHLRTLFTEKTRARCELELKPESEDPSLEDRTEPFHVALDSAWIKHHEQPFGCCLSTCIDISSFKRLQLELEEARIQAEKASSLKSQFLANMSHEIRTPLSSVLGYVDLLRQDIQEPSQKEKLEIVYQAGKHLLFLLNELIDLSRIEHGHFELQSAPFLPSTLLTSLQDLFEHTAKERQITLSFTQDFVPEPLIGDLERIRQILVNIIGNALKFTPKDGLIEVRMSYEQGVLKIRVRDTGPGIPPGQTSAIFELFHQGDNSDTRSHGGSGLGLAISQRLAKLMGGKIKLKSRVGEGSLFTVKLPLPVSEDESDFDDFSGIMPAPFLPTGKEERIPRVLIVDDDRILQRLLGIFVERMGYEHDIAIHGEDALKKLAQTHYDLVLLDLQMPVMDGYQTVRQIRANQKLQKLPVIALTAKAIQDDLNKCLAAGCDSYITKPVAYKEFARQLHRYLRPLVE